MSAIGDHAFACRYSFVFVASATVCTIRTRANRPYRLNGAFAPAATVTGVKSASAVLPSVPYSTVTTVVPPATASQPSACVQPLVSTHGPKTGENATVTGVTVSQITSPL